jgi:hypothetical protein
MISYHGILEIDTDRGVIYFHDDKTGSTKLRICGLEDLRNDGDLIDITSMAKFIYPKKEICQE